MARRAWRTVLSATELPLLTQPAAAFAQNTLEKLLSRVLKRGKGLPDLSDEARHRLRIAFKNLRYGVDFFRNLFDHRHDIRSYIKKISAMQDRLGAHNDIVSARPLLEELAPALGAAGERASGFALGWFAHQVSIADSGLKLGWKKFKREDKFWE